MKINSLKKYTSLIIAYFVISALFLFIGGEQLVKVSISKNHSESRGVLPEFSEGQYLEQSFNADMDLIEEIQLIFATYARENQGMVYLKLFDTESGSLLADTQVDVSELNDNQPFSWFMPSPVEVERNQSLQLYIETNCVPGESIALYYSDLIENGKMLICNGEAIKGQLSLSVSGKNYSLFGMYYWGWMTLAGVLIFGYLIWSDYQETKGKLTWAKQISTTYKKYNFLIQQLVSRDFKTKYKRSVLGYLWSFLNPLLTMFVQYLVFSTIFKSGIENYPVYLLTGVILFNFFSEAVGQGLCSIIYNASLITKVYVPKFIYPVTKVASVSINLFISIVPLLFVALMTGVRISTSWLLLPFVLTCLLIFCVGMVLMLSAATVFFRDTQYLWGIASMVWMYATPLFYPETIIPPHLRFIQTLNPMYHMIKFARIIIIEGISPAPALYGTCLLSACITCMLGAFIFGKTQNKFVLYI